MKLRIPELHKLIKFINENAFKNIEEMLNEEN